MHRISLVLPAALVASSACGTSKSPDSPHNIDIRTAPLNLPGIDFACYDVLVENGAATPETVIARGTVGQSLADGDTTTLCSTRFGNGPGGDISYVAPCDAQLAGHTVTLWVDGVYTGTPEAPVMIAYQDPCPAGCALPVTCVENADTPVTFNLTIMRPANQGFFDIGVNFDDIFCSAKVDCETADGLPLNLLHHPVSKERAQTAVLALACSAGPGATDDTVLFRDPIVVTCAGMDPIVLDPTLGEGNVYGPIMADPDPADPVWQYATYFGDEALDCGGMSCNKRYWNVAIGFDPLANDCRLTTMATAANAAAMTGFETPALSTYPHIEVDIALTGPTGSLACERHPLNGSPAGVATRYTTLSATRAFCHRYMASVPDSDETNPDCTSDFMPLAFGWYSLSPYYSLNTTYQYTEGLSDAERVELWRRPLVEAAAQGWDFVMRYGASNPIYVYSLGDETYDLIRFLDDAEMLGVRVMVDLERTGAVPTPEIIDEVVGAVKDHPAVYGYYLIDEPELRMFAPYNVTVPECVAAYNQVKTLDPQRPVVITMSGDIGIHAGFLDAADMIGKELYAPEHWDTIEDDIAVVRAAGKPFFIVPRIYVGEGLYAQTLPSFEAFQFNILMPVAMGALQQFGGGIFPFIFEGFSGGTTAPPSTTDFRETLVYPNTALLKTLAPYLRAGENTGAGFEWLSAPANPDAFRYVLLGRDASDLLLVIAHRGDTPANVSFRINALSPGTDVAARLDAPGVLVLGSDGAFPMQRFMPGEARVFRIANNGCNPGAPCQLAIRADAITPSFSLLDPTDPDRDVGRLVDGDPNTAFGFGAGPQASLLIDLGAAYPLDRIDLTVLQSPYGVTLHEIETGLTADAMTVTATLNQFTQTHDVLNAPLGGVVARFVRVRTVSSPSWVAWQEVAVYRE